MRSRSRRGTVRERATLANTPDTEGFASASPGRRHGRPDTATSPVGRRSEHSCRRQGAAPRPDGARGGAQGTRRRAGDGASRESQGVFVNPNFRGTVILLLVHLLRRPRTGGVRPDTCPGSGRGGLGLDEASCSSREAPFRMIGPGRGSRLRKGGRLLLTFSDTRR